MLPFLSSDFHWCCQCWRRIFHLDGCYKTRAAGRNWSRRNCCWLLGILHSWIGYPHIHFVHCLRRKLDSRQFHRSIILHSEWNFPTIADNCLFKKKNFELPANSWRIQLVTSTDAEMEAHLVGDGRCTAVGNCWEGAEAKKATTTAFLWPGAADKIVVGRWPQRPTRRSTPISSVWTFENKECDY